MGDLLQPWHLIVLAVVAFLLFGAKRLPELGKGLGEGLKGFREGIRGITDPPPPPPPPAPPMQQQNSASAAVIERAGRAEDSPARVIQPK